jgi:hypothetical protein
MWMSVKVVHNRRVSDDLRSAWEELHDATPAGWFVGRPRFHDESNEWQMFAFDTNDRARPGKPRIREWTAVGTVSSTCSRRWHAASR